MASDEIHIPLNPLDHVLPRNYVRLLFPLELKPDAKAEAVFDDLREALHKTFVQEPWISGKVWRQSLDTPGWRPGQLEIRHRPYSPNGSRPHQLKYQQLETDWTYQDLKDAGFPSNVFDEQVLLDAPQTGNVDVGGADVLIAQANFLPGGLLLGITLSHMATDGFAVIQITQLWAENFHGLHGRDAGGQIRPTRFSQEDRDRTLVERIWERESAGKASSHQPDDPWLRALVGLDADYPGEDVTVASQRAASRAPLLNGHSSHPDTSRSMLNRIMFISSHDLSALHKKCLSHPSPPTSPSLSIGDALNALFWRATLKARSASATARGRPLLDTISVFESPIDVRDLFGPDFPPNYLGNCLLFNTARMPLAELIAASTPLGKVAAALRKGAARLDGNAVRDAYGLLRTVPDLSRVQGRFVERPDSADILLSNVMAFPLGLVKFGERWFGNQGTPHVMRVLHGPYDRHVRLGHVLPRNPHHGGVELSVNLFEDEMLFLDADEEFGRFVDSVEACRVEGLA